ncbi:hypothetical protein SAMN04487947_3423 [Halogeometricum rufum]|uniref:Uncharacterized protein n=1 Tax=Halogeometricum rufum TaxID=553469 RepID=A0A1I6IMB6_9EURY|nr:hypothetical protein [Halogeometricum rufum]SFR67420.1 hypothetical protein SAMN04487947_3423 [Halogeometricum rufum]
MTGRPASLLTKTQRRRIRDEFEELNEQQRRRDQRQIRERIRAGAFDFEPLAAYPNRQLDLAFEDVPDDEVEAALANATLFVERLRVLEGIERDAVVRRAREAGADAAASDGTPSLDELDLHTETEIRRDAEQTVAERLAPNRWDERADVLLKLAAAGALPLFVVTLANAATARGLIGENTFVGISVYLCVLVVAFALTGVFLVKGAQTLKHDVLPWVRLLRRTPAGAFRGVVEWVRRPGAKLRQVWDEL